MLFLKQYGWFCKRCARMHTHTHTHTISSEILHSSATPFKSERNRKDFTIIQTHRKTIIAGRTYISRSPTATLILAFLL